MHMRHKTMVIWAAPVAVLVVLTVFNAPAYAGDAHPNFSPDDSRLVYMSDGEIKVAEIKTGKEHLYLVRPDSSGLRRVTGPAAADRPQVQQKK